MTTPVAGFFRTLSLTDVNWAFTKGNLLARIDFYDDEKNCYTDIEMPGVEEKDINISVREGSIKIKGEKKHSYLSKQQRWLYYKKEMFISSID